MPTSTPVFDMAPHRATPIELYVDVDETYQENLLRRLREYGITQRAVCDEAGIIETQFSRWVARPSEYTERPVDLRWSNILKIEQAIARIRARQKRADRPGR